MKQDLEVFDADREFTVFRLSLGCWRHLLIGIHCVILIDHAALTYLTWILVVNLVGNYFFLLKNDFIGKICIDLLNSFVRNVLYVNKIKLVHSSLLVNCNL